MISYQLWAAKVVCSSLIGEGGESIRDPAVEKLGWETSHRPQHSWQVTEYKGIWCCSCNREKGNRGAAVDRSMLLQSQSVVSWSVASLVNIDAVCRSNSKSCFILRKRRRLPWQCIFLAVSIFHLPVECNCWARCVCYFLVGFVYVILTSVIDSESYPFWFSAYWWETGGQRKPEYFGSSAFFNIVCTSLAWSYLIKCGFFYKVWILKSVCYMPM